tara:strand:+ start:4070 stop:4837 length:768 start_codon:yes stop_codon:yes gene_type:complete
MISVYFQSILIALVQGVSEFIPVSSSAHLLLISYLSKFNYTSLEVDISLHLGSLLAILVYFWKDLINILDNKKLLHLIIFGSIPLIVIGFIVNYFDVIYLLRNLKLIAWTTLIFGIVLFFADKKIAKNNIENNLNFKNIIVIGIFQVLALVPGVSRSGIVITASRMFGFKRVDSAKISFFLSIPALFGASVLGAGDILNKNIDFNFIILISIFFSFIFSFLTIKYLLKYLEKFSLNIFIYYRIILSIILFLIVYG